MSDVDDFLAACDKARAVGYNVVAVLSKYDADGADFHTRLSLSGSEAEQDHYLLDAVREVSVSWSNLRHKSQLEWDDKK